MSRALCPHWAAQPATSSAQCGEGLCLVPGSWALGAPAHEAGAQGTAAVKVWDEWSVHSADFRTKARC